MAAGVGTADVADVGAVAVAAAAVVIKLMLSVPASATVAAAGSTIAAFPDDASRGINDGRGGAALPPVTS